MKTSTTKKPAIQLLLSLLFDSRWILAIATIASVTNGISSVLLITLINKALLTPTDDYVPLAWYFAILTVLAIACRCSGSRKMKKRVMKNENAPYLSK
ncbi:hypothetical protein V6917_16385 [Pectobacterium brasiliense]|uniref:hypothetical protein n=1 Tax=Pectobacterium brasiliense TaxID=180957 RepID=UPI0030D2816A